MNDRCAVPGCRCEVDVVYLDHGLCAHHWNQLTAEDQPADALARALGIPVATATTTETIMSEATTTETKPAKATKRTKKTKAEAKPAKKAKAAKEAKPKKERTEPAPDRVFAIRITTPELEALHKASGPRNATRLVRALTVAFVNADPAAFAAILKESRELRG